MFFVLPVGGAKTVSISLGSVRVFKRLTTSRKKAKAGEFLSDGNKYEYKDNLFIRLHFILERNLRIQYGASLCGANRELSQRRNSSREN